MGVLKKPGHRQDSMTRNDDDSQASLDFASDAGISIYSDAVMAHMNGYALARALTETMGDVQAVLMTKYAENLIKLSEAFHFDISDVETYLAYLKRTRRAPSMEVVQERPGYISLNIQACSIARIIHKSLKISGYSGHICPIAMAFMVVKAMDLGWVPGKNLFDYIRFSGKFSYVTDIGSKTEFELVKA